MIRVFHGFLGSPEDFQFLKHKPQVILHDLYRDSAFEVSPNDTLIGYSLGGRIVLDLFLKTPTHQLVLIGAHPGLTTAQERLERSRWEDEVLRRLGSNNFLTWWNDLPVFRYDRPLTQVRDGSAEIFEKHRLSLQSDYLPILRGHEKKILWLAGEQDERYRDLLASRIAPAGIRTRLLPGGHRSFQHPQALLSVLETEGIL